MKTATICIALTVILSCFFSASDIQAPAARHAGRVDFGGGMADRITPTGAVH